MSALKSSFTFRLSREDKAALSALAKRWGCDRGEALRRLIRRSDARLSGGHFAANGHTFRIRLRKERP